MESDSEESDDSEYERQVKKNTDARKRVKVAIVIATVKAIPIV